MKKLKPELISPAGDLEKLKTAFLYGADAVYASTPKFSMRTREIGFTEKSLKEGIAYAHSLGKKIYLTLNTFPHSSEIEALKKHAKKTVALKPDAIIVADPGTLAYIKTITKIPIHLSTQANTTNYLSAEFWRKQGVKRIVLARELSLKNIKLISKHSKIEIEAFVHGAMCMAYSGRCQISNYMLGRDPNKGVCAQPCRYKYRLYELEEDSRKGQKYQMYEDEAGSYILNSKDLCMIEHIPELIDAGVTSFKIEGRLKGIYYVGAVTRAYRQAIDQYFENPNQYKTNRTKYKNELKKTSSRGFETGFYFHKANKNTNNYITPRAKSNWDLLGIVKDYQDGEMIVELNNRTIVGSRIEIITPVHIIKSKISRMVSNKKEIVVGHSGTLVNIPIDKEVAIGSFVRAKIYI
jgi:U32 family peptidase